MLRKVLLIVVLLCFGFCFGGEIPQNLKAKYKAEVENYIAQQLPIIIKNIDREYNRGITIYKNCLADKNKPANLEPYLTYLEGASGAIDSEEFHLYLGLIDITDKYTKIKQDLPIIDTAVELAIFVHPYLTENNIDLTNITKIVMYADKKISELEKYINALHKIKN